MQFYPTSPMSSDGRSSSLLAVGGGAGSHTPVARAMAASFWLRTWISRADAAPGPQLWRYLNACASAGRGARPGGQIIADSIAARVALLLPRLFPPPAAAPLPPLAEDAELDGIHQAREPHQSH